MEARGGNPRGVVIPTAVMTKGKSSDFFEVPMIVIMAVEEEDHRLQVLSDNVIGHKLSTAHCAIVISQRNSA
jgi:hypothetical protein